MNPVLDIEPWAGDLEIGRLDSNGAAAVIFIHGIQSSHDTFERAIGYFKRDLNPKKYHYFYFDYNYRLAIRANGIALARALRDFHARWNGDVILVCHSMGGLVARFALLLSETRLSFVKMLFLVGTPNMGAIRLRQLGFFYYILFTSGGRVGAMMNRSPGILDLTEVALQIQEKIKENQELVKNTDDTLYVTIPGCYFNENRHLPDFSQLDGPGRRYVNLENFLRLVEAFPSAAVKIERPHDGIVEETSNCLIPSGTGRWSEKNKSINYPESGPPTYIHITLAACDELMHSGDLAVHCAEKVVDVICDFIEAGAINAWVDQLSDEKKRVTNFRIHGNG